MHIEVLKVFCDVVGFSSFSRAAEENCMTQSAASQAIGKLEKELGVILIDRSHRPWRLTDAGKVAYDRSREVLECYYRLEIEVNAAHDNHQTEIRVAVIYSVGLAYMSECARDFSEYCPEGRLRIDYLHPEEVSRRVLEDETDIGVMAFAPARRELSVTRWREEEMVAAVAPDHHLAGYKTLRLAQLDGSPLVSFDHGITIGREVEKRLKACGLRNEVVSRFDNIEAIKRAVESGAAVAILPAPSLSREVASGSLVALTVEGLELKRPLEIIHRRGRELTPAMERFINDLAARKAPPAGQRRQAV